MARGTILDQTLDHIHFAPSKRKRSLDLEDFEETAVSQARQRQGGSKAPTPSPPSNVMPSMYDIENLDILSPGQPPARRALHLPPEDFFRSYTAEPASSPSPFQNDDRLQETINTTARLSAASTMTIGESVVANDDIDDSEDEDSDEDEEQIRPPPSTQAKKSAPKKPRARSRELAESSEEEAEVPPKKKLRERTLAQEQPYQFDKVRYNMSKKNGGDEVDKSHVEQELISTQRKAAKTKKKAKTSPKAQAKPKKGRESTGRFSSVDTGRSTPTSAAATPDLDRDFELPSDRILQNTTLKIWSEGDDGGANVIQLADCPTLVGLFDHVDDTWGKAYGKKATRVNCRLPWKDEKANIAVRREWGTSFRHFLREIKKAPVWRKKGAAELEVHLVVILG